MSEKSSNYSIYEEELGKEIFESAKKFHDIEGQEKRHNELIEKKIDNIIEDIEEELELENEEKIEINYNNKSNTFYRT